MPHQKRFFLVVYVGWANAKVWGVGQFAILAPSFQETSKIVCRRGRRALILHQKANGLETSAKCEPWSMLWHYRKVFYDDCLYNHGQKLTQAYRKKGLLDGSALGDGSELHNAPQRQNAIVCGERSYLSRCIVLSRKKLAIYWQTLGFKKVVNTAI